MTDKPIKERTAIAFTKLPQAGKDYMEGYMRGVLMAYEHMREKSPVNVAEKKTA
ncbi:MAG: hypothetical protein LKF71_04485 [Oscillospiraceae bacterium]|jgi:hypothetical protein|nr:hypothetical protein [Oscillospiraceae bacterium]